MIPATHSYEAVIAGWLHEQHKLTTATKGSSRSRSAAESRPLAPGRRPAAGAAGRSSRVLGCRPARLAHDKHRRALLVPDARA